MTRGESKQAMLDERGAVPVVADALDSEQVADAVGRAKRDVIPRDIGRQPLVCCANPVASRAK
jgi:hypothetical protein